MITNQYRHLTSPMITLYVGKNHTEYHVHKDKLCQVSRFRDALEEQSGEDLQTISMPEDPEVFVALIEWLYFGKYVYCANKLQVKTLTKLLGAFEAPSKLLLEGLFHLEVCNTAYKYDCTHLLKEAKRRVYATKEKLNDIDALRLCRAQIASGMQESPLLPKLMIATNPQALRKWVDRLLQGHRAEVYGIIKEFPDLGICLLECCTQGSSKD